MKKVLLLLVAVLAFNLSSAQEIDTSKYDGVYAIYQGVLKVGKVEIDNGSVMFKYGYGSMLTNFGFVLDGNPSEGVFTSTNDLYGEYTYKIFKEKKGKVKGEMTSFNRGLITKTKLKKINNN